MLSQAPGRGLIYRRHGHLRMEAYFDVGHAGDKGDYKSTIGYCTYIGGNLVTWQSRKQKVVSCSRMESKLKFPNEMVKLLRGGVN